MAVSEGTKVTNQECEWRPLRPAERAVLDRLLSRPFAGDAEIKAQLATAQVRVIDADGSLRFQVDGPFALGRSRVLANACYLDGLGDDFSPHVHLLLHVTDGKLHELEIYKDDGTPIGVGAYEIEPTRIEAY